MIMRFIRQIYGPGMMLSQQVNHAGANPESHSSLLHSIFLELGLPWSWSPSTGFIDGFAETLYGNNTIGNKEENRHNLRENGSNT